MPRGTYGRFRWDSGCALPARSQHRARKRARMNSFSSEASSTEDGLSSGSERTFAICQESVENTESGVAASFQSDSLRPAEDRSEENRSGGSDVTEKSSEVWHDLNMKSTGQSDDHSSAEQWEPSVQQPSVQDPPTQGEELYPGCRITRSERLLLVMGHSLRHYSTKEASESFLKIIDAHLPNGASLPLSKHLFLKYFTTGSQAAKQYFYCPGCFSYFGTITADQDVSCSSCQLVHSSANLTNSGMSPSSF